MAKFELKDPLSWLSPNTEKDKNAVEIEVEKINIVYSQPRRNILNDELKELEDSIKKYGLIEPVIVKQNGKFYNLICGERRLTAIKNLGLKNISAVIRDDIKDEDIFLIQIVENIQRKDLDPLELGDAYKKLSETRTIQEVAELVGKPKTHVFDMISLLSLDEELKPKITKNNIRKAVEIGRIKDEKIRKEMVANFDALEIKDVKNKKFSRGKKISIEALINNFNDTHESKIEVVFSKKYTYINIKAPSSLKPLKILKRIIKIKED